MCGHLIIAVLPVEEGELLSLFFCVNALLVIDGLVISRVRNQFEPVDPIFGINQIDIAGWNCL